MRSGHENYPDYDTKTSGQTSGLFHIIRKGGIVM